MGGKKKKKSGVIIIKTIRMVRLLFCRKKPHGFEQKRKENKYSHMGDKNEEICMSACSGTTTYIHTDRLRHRTRTEGRRRAGAGARYHEPCLTIKAIGFKNEIIQKNGIIDFCVMGGYEHDFNVMVLLFFVTVWCLIFCSQLHVFVWRMLTQGHPIGSMLMSSAKEKSMAIEDLIT